MTAPHTYIYSYDGMSTGILGWILQDSPSYKTKLFKMDQATIDADEESDWRNDPWDNHGDSSGHWSHEYIKNLEVDNDDFSWWDKFVDTFPGPGIFGLSYGSYQKTGVWKNGKVILLGPHGDDLSTLKYKKMFIEIYWRRPFDLEDMVESIDMHTHDHHEDCTIYKFTLTRKLRSGIELARAGELEFWQLQMVYHHGYEQLPEKTPEEIDKLLDLYDEEMGTGKGGPLDRDPDVIKVDLFNLDIPRVCEQLGIEYSEEMQHNYNQFKEWCDRICAKLKIEF